MPIHLRPPWNVLYILTVYVVLMIVFTWVIALANRSHFGYATANAPLEHCTRTKAGYVTRAFTGTLIFFTIPVPLFSFPLSGLCLTLRFRHPSLDIITTLLPLGLFALFWLEIWIGCEVEGPFYAEPMPTFCSQWYQSDLGKKQISDLSWAKIAVGCLVVAAETMYIGLHAWEILWRRWEERRGVQLDEKDGSEGELGPVSKA